MTHFTHFVEKMFWGSVGLAVGLVVLFAILHVLRTQAVNVPAVGAPVANAAGWVGAHATNY
ncbi:MAG TPA: hypothetical protein VN207_00940 [Ktedonobacteraceae bacterium]|nr:hypothetical protein [Ktedonobacteraceae bacterium]